MKLFVAPRLSFQKARNEHSFVLLLVFLAHVLLFLCWRTDKLNVHADAENLVTIHLNFPRPEQTRRQDDKLSPKVVAKQTSKPSHKPKTISSQAGIARLVPGVEPAPPLTPSMQLRQPEPASPALDLDGLVKEAIAADRHREISPIERLHEEQFVKNSVESKMEDAAKRGTRKHCQNAYSGMGLLAVVPLVIDTVRDKGCKWD